jgi:DNA methyltransferase 1-associated protein 1
MSGASAADVRSILSLPSSSTSTPAQPKKAATPLSRKPSGISRELYSLIGPSAPTLVAQVAKPRLKQKPNLGSGGSSKWYISFTFAFPERWSWKMVAGCGGLSRTLRERMGLSSVTGSKPTPIQMLVCFSFYPSVITCVKSTSEYPFARYNAKSPDYTYSEEEYTKFLEGARLVHSPATQTHIIGRPGMDKGRDRLSFQSYPRIRFSVLHRQRPL